MGKRRPTSGLSVKSARLLAAWGVEQALADGAGIVPVGPLYNLDDGHTARVAFRRDEEGRLCVGYALERDGQWEMREEDPFSARSLGYYRRRLKRIGKRDEVAAASANQPHRGSQGPLSRITRGRGRG